MVSISHKGDFSKTMNFLKSVKTKRILQDCEKYGIEGVNALRNATPVESGETANSWYYEVERTDKSLTISFKNSHINQDVNIALILQYGHATKNGGWVQGRDYINPAIQPIFDKMADAAWKEVTK